MTTIGDMTADTTAAMTMTADTTAAMIAATGQVAAHGRRCPLPHGT
ncbi:hypothetical protein NOI24_26820 [Neorhizobium galegae]|nr:hypothetical protein [Neorhizobium galegae]MCQ1774915.1 hypothetical protein [Neorhizobium galegae]MCQ1799427.1 hypothetical protein [Neorhizobium galegae]